MENREKFVEAVESHQASMSAVCREYGISRKTGYKWLARVREGQPLNDQSRRPKRQPGKTGPEIERLILELRAWDRPERA